MGIGWTVNLQKFKQKFDFLGLDPLFDLPEAALFITGDAPKCRHRRIGRRSGALDRLRWHAYNYSQMFSP